jgi:hypothetical protein
MTQETNNKPVDTLRDGALKAAIFENQGEKGPFYSVKITRTYTDAQGNYRDSSSFSGSELLRVAHLAAKAYDRSNELRVAAQQQDAA